MRYFLIVLVLLLALGGCIGLGIQANNCDKKGEELVRKLNGTYHCGVVK